MPQKRLNPVLSLVIPTYNEAQNIAILIPRLAKILAKIPHEIIIADHNSPDKTYDKALVLKERFPQVHAICRTHHRGLSPAVIDGFQIARGRYLAVMDADLQHDERILPEMVKKLEAGADLVVASRKAEGGGVSDWSAFRRFISWGASLLAHMLFPRLPSDPMSGYFALSATLFQRISKDINPRGFKILLEIVTKAKNIHVAEVGYVFKPREYGESKLSGAVALNYLIALAELRFAGVFSREYLKFVLVGLTGIVVNQLCFAVAKRYANLPDERALIVGIEAAILWNFTINNLFTFREQMLHSFGAIVRGVIFFQGICLIGAYINYAIALHLSHFLGFDIYLANTIGIVIASFWNFFLNANTVWKQA